MNDCSLISLEENKVYTSLTRKEWVSVDLGFRGMQNIFKHTAFPFPDNIEKVTLTDQQKQFNSEFKTIRTVVENVIQYLKKWKICKHVYRSFNSDISLAQEEHHKVWVVVAGLVNKFVMPCRTYEKL